MGVIFYTVRILGWVLFLSMVLPFGLQVSFDVCVRTPLRVPRVVERLWNVRGTFVERSFFDFWVLGRLGCRLGSR